MTRKQQRIYAIVLVMTGLAVAAFLSLTALRQNITFFYSPSDILDAQTKPVTSDRPFRLGGMVKAGSVEKSGTTVRFTVTDFQNEIDVTYTGIIPGLFAEDQGVIATGTLDSNNHFTATQLLAKHDENYMPPEVAKALKHTEEHTE